MASSSSSSPSASTDGRSSLLTFGIEMEFVVAYLPEGAPDPHPDDGRNAYIGGKHPDFVSTEHPYAIRGVYYMMSNHPEMLAVARRRLWRRGLAINRREPLKRSELTLTRS
ncbi:uncharacterized protein PG986_002062 [Apiospora aurea]|uniref:Uncharacterized protein n=1 Tax=Apiospora aurea TaxID=335848 RepID=A0ABR1R0F4_9PEZI